MRKENGNGIPGAPRHRAGAPALRLRPGMRGGCARDAGGMSRGCMGRESGFVDLNNKWPTKFYLLICSIINNAL